MFHSMVKKTKFGNKNQMETQFVEITITIFGMFFIFYLTYLKIFRE